MIWFMAPDLAEASGGLKIIYRMVEALNAQGRPATVWHGTPGHGYTTFVSDAPIHHATAVTLAPGDVLVMHEVGGPRWSFLAGSAPVVMLCQGQSFVFDHIDFDTNLAPGYPGWPHVTSVLATSRYVEAVVRRISGPGVDVHRVPLVVDGDVFRPRTKERVIAYMPRRRRQDLVAVVQLLRRGGDLAGWTFLPIEGATESQVAEALGRSAIFLSGAEREGFGLPGAEAMAAGCYVVGFTGDGGREFMLDDCCSPIHDADVLAMADRVREAAHRYDEDRAWLDGRVAAGRQRVLSRYSAEQFRSALGEAFDVVCAPGSPSLVTSPVTLSHYQSHAPRPGVLHETYRASRRLARRAVNRARGRRAGSSTGQATSN